VVAEPDSSARPRVPPTGERDVPATKLAQLVAERLVDEIIKRGWPVGENLGAEPELMATYGVSRAVLREAVRLVEHMGIATMRRGPRGGLIVTSSSVSAVTDAIAIFLETEAVNVDDILQAKIVLELQAVRLAADRLDPPGKEALLGVPMEREGASRGREAGESNLHIAIAEATGNPALLLFIDALSRLERRYVAAAWSDDHAPRMHVGASLAQAHRAIADAVVRGEGLLARHRMLVHLESLARFVRQARAGTGSNLSGPGPGPSSGSAPGPAPAGMDRAVSVAAGVSAVTSEGRKLGEVTAARIRRDIAERCAPVGTNLGSERALLSAYGVSRSVLREAVRLLEYHSVARMRRGPGGGLIVIEPDAEAVIRAVSLYLQSAQVDPHDLYEAREALELASVAEVVEGLDADGLEAVRASLDQEVLRPPGLSDLGASNLHGTLAELTGNRIVALFTQILLHLTVGCLSQMPDPDWDELQRRCHETHVSIVEAIEAGDTAEARRRMREHLWALENLPGPAPGS
jgi:DNA-binding FadR family transcriptional regulator